MKINCNNCPGFFPTGPESAVHHPLLSESISVDDIIDFVLSATDLNRFVK